MPAPATAPGRPGTLGRRRRPAVLDASRTALIPLRPLTVGEILDGAFLIVRRNLRLMVGLPLVVAGGTAAYVLAGVGLWLLLGNTTARTAQIVLVVLMGLAGLLALQQCLVWMTAILSRVSLQTVLGEGFAPVSGAVTLRSSWPLFWPMLGLSALQYVALGVVQTVVTLLYYALFFGALLIGRDSDVLAVVASILGTVLTYFVAVLAYGYLGLTVPALSTESRHAPGWIGKPARPTNVITAFGRSITLVGRRNLVRVALVNGGMGVVCLGVLALVGVGTLAVVLLFASSISLDVFTVLTDPWTIFGVSAFAVVVALSALLAYTSAVQTLLYLDLRMRREGLDLAMRFDCMPIPQPSAPPAPPLGYLPPGSSPAWGPPPSAVPSGPAQEMR